LSVGVPAITAVSGSAGNTTLSTPQIPSHTHPTNLWTLTGAPAPSDNAVGVGGRSSNIVSGATGGGGAHSHPFSFSSGSGTFSGNAINLAVK
jgi:hypothetical protein